MASHLEDDGQLPPVARAARPGVGEAADPRFRRQQPRPVRGASPRWSNCRVGHSPARACGRSLRRQQSLHSQGPVSPLVTDSVVLRFLFQHP